MSFAVAILEKTPCSTTFTAALTPTSRNMPATAFVISTSDRYLPERVVMDVAKPLPCPASASNAFALAGSKPMALILGLNPNVFEVSIWPCNKVPLPRSMRSRMSCLLTARFSAWRTRTSSNGGLRVSKVRIKPTVDSTETALMPLLCSTCGTRSIGTSSMMCVSPAINDATRVDASGIWRSISRSTFGAPCQ